MNISGIMNSTYLNNTSKIKQSQGVDTVSSATKTQSIKKLDTIANQTKIQSTKKPDAISSATKKNGGDHYFEARA
ncbi:hypothetical protein [Clostridium sp.]|uniref:hypothetical protein n=1 Tax=Clostridium sp. TaxID=1506 RepID=UPI0028496F00|nr:hypothetical protein [Clostridium sp.]MDR3593632.1 hypothetical protein [Clostridium sp.]